MSATPSVSCVFVCHDGNGRILLARRAPGARDEAGAWDCGAGALEFGETFEAAVTREVTEEYTAAPLEITPLGMRNVLRGDPVESHWVAAVFAVRVDPAAVAIGEPHKFDALEWFAPDALPSPVHSQLRETLALFAPAPRPVTAIALLEAAPGREDDVRAQALSMVAPSQAEPGNIAYEAYTHPERPGAWLVFEQWRDRGAFAAHLDSPHLKDALAAGPDLLAGPPRELVFEADAGTEDPR